MRILIAHNFYREPGGEDSVYRSEAALLEDAGHEVVRHEVHNDDVREDSPFRAARAAFWNPAAFDAVETKILRHRPDVAHFHNTFPLLSPSVYDACRRHGVPVVQTLHNYRLSCPMGMHFRDGGPCTDCHGKWFKWPGVLHACYRNSRPATAVTSGMLAYHDLRGTYREKVDRFIALTSFARSMFVGEGIPESKIVVKGNSVSDEGMGPGGRGALYVGRLGQEKGIATMLEGWRRAGTGGRLRIVGDGALRTVVEEAALDDPSIEYLGSLSRDEVVRLMHTSAYLVFPSESYEGMPMVILEAFATGLPVLAADLGAASMMVEDGKTGWKFGVGDPSSLASAIRDVEASGVSPDVRRRAREVYERHYSPERNLRALEDLYEGVKRRAGRTSVSADPRA